MRAQVISSNVLSLIDARRNELFQAEGRGHFDPLFIGEIAEAGFFDLTKPKHYGGEEVDYEALLALVVDIARRSGSLAWCLMIMAQHNILVRRGSMRLLDELFGQTPLLLASSFHPAGMAVPTDGGYVLSGTWKYITGIHWANWVMVGALVEGEASGDVAEFVVPAHFFHIHDDWLALGMLASGSNSATLSEVEVPAAFRLDGRGPETDSGLGFPRIYQIPQRVMTAFATGAPVIGMLSQMMREVIQGLPPKRHGSSLLDVAQRERLLRLRMEVEGIESQFRLLCRTASRIAAGLGFSSESQFSAIARVAALVDRSRALSSELFAWHGTKAVNRQHPAATRLVDVHVLSTHYLVRPEIANIEYTLSTLNHPTA